MENETLSIKLNLDPNRNYLVEKTYYEPFDQSKVGKLLNARNLRKNFAKGEASIEDRERVEGGPNGFKVKKGRLMLF